MQGIVWRRATRFVLRTSWACVISTFVQLHTSQEYPDEKLLDHTKELISQLDALGIGSAPLGEDDGDDGWEDAEDDSEEDVEMS